MRHPGDRRVRRRLLMIGAGGCVLAIVVSVVGLAGGLDRVPPAEPPVLAVDERNEGEPWTVTVDGAALAADLAPAVLQEEGYWLAVIAEVEITAGETRRDVSEILCARDLAGRAREPLDPLDCTGAIPPDDLRLVRDGSAVTILHPGMPERVAFLWELAADTPPPADVHLEILGKTQRRDTLTDRLQWLDPAPRAQLTVPVEDRREEV